VFCDGPMNDLAVSKESGWDLLAEAAVPVMHELIGRGYPPGGTIIRAMAAKLLSRGRINPHFDSHAPLLPTRAYASSSTAVPIAWRSARPTRSITRRPTAS
jgi:hypothetical protein